MTVRIAPTPSLEAAPLWGLLTGSLTAAVIGVLAKFSGGPLGAGRLGSVGPAAAEVGIVAVLEIGVTSAITAGLVNWLILRHHMKRLARAAESAVEHADAPIGSVIDETDDAGGHRIYFDPWASEREAEEAEAAEEAGEGPVG
jgi:hypothetical protein